MSGLNGAGSEVERAISAMRDKYRENVWMLDEHWPLNEPHVRLMIADVIKRFPLSSHARVLDVGCFNGYISLLFRELGYEVTGTDVWDDEFRDCLFADADIRFVPTNLNNSDSLGELPANDFDVVIVAQVIEHILNHPLGLLRSLARTMRTDGIIIITTPNPATIMNASRALRGHSLLWGTNEFIAQPKIDQGKVISQGDIHYREYTHSELRQLLETAGLVVERSQFLGLGVSRSQKTLKKLLKSNPITRGLTSQRLLASNHYFLARKP